MAANAVNISPDTLIGIRITLNDVQKKLKLPLKDLTPSVLPGKLRTCLNIDPKNISIFERYSDSVGGFVTLDPNDGPVFKSLVRAAKAKGKIRIKCTIIPPEVEQEQGVPQPLIEVPGSIMQEKSSKPTIEARNLGSGIFAFRDARASQQTLVKEEAPVPAPFTSPVSDETRHATLKACQELAFRAREPVTATPGQYSAWSVFCNVCDQAMADAHYHCSICDGGDYDLCENCVSSGKTCPGEDHWLIKRFIKDGKVITSTTERFRKTPEVEAKVPGAFIKRYVVGGDEPVDPVKHVCLGVYTDKVLTPTKAPELTRTCNNCVNVLPERNFVTCQTCEDFDLCIPCHSKNEHGHHPAHAFDKATVDTFLSPALTSLLEPGRNVTHNAFCDGCDKKIVGIRHKCLQCPDWDYCNDCIGGAPKSHPRHRFAALYEQLPEPSPSYIRHFGIYCDGPLCNGKTHQVYIRGPRYKCAVCHDTDFCAQCEALPGNHHNRTHPLIKFTTPVKNVNITTINEDTRGHVRNMGDKQPEPVKTEPLNAPIPVQTVADIAPTEEKPAVVQRTAQPIDGDIATTRASPVPASMLNAEFVKDTIPDGTFMTPGERFTQVWTLRNVGPFVWPAGCSVRYVGGDNMLNVDNRRPNSVASINKAIESSVVARDVQVGEEIAFSIMLKAPMRPGKSISYWRLKAADGTPFGHRLWCDIDVRNKVELSSAMGNALPPVPPMASKPPMQRLDLARFSSAAQRDLQERMKKLYQAEPTDLKTSLSPELEAARSRLEALRAKILETRAEIRPFHATGPLSTYTVPVVKPPVSKGLFSIPIRSAAPAEQSTPEPVPAPIPTAEAVPASVKSEEPEETVDSTTSSQMVFPKLEKESPASSMIVSSKGKAAYIENEAGEVEGTAVPQSPLSTAATPVAEPIEANDFDDVEILSVSEDDYEDDDGFLTDEEYDILDASDRETVHSP